MISSHPTMLVWTLVAGDACEGLLKAVSNHFVPPRTVLLSALRVFTLHPKSQGFSFSSEILSHSSEMALSCLFKPGRTNLHLLNVLLLH
jgi:hypothetical protein